MRWWALALVVGSVAASVMVLVWGVRSEAPTPRMARVERWVWDLDSEPWMVPPPM